jgi:hypothetical protein
MILTTADACMKNGVKNTNHLSPQIEAIKEDRKRPNDPDCKFSLYNETVKFAIFVYIKLS